MEKESVEAIVNQVRLSVLMGDITQQETDAIVNAANPSLMGGGGVDGAIHSAGGGVISEECKQIVFRQGRLPTGKAVITSGGKLKARYVVHTVGPIWHGGDRGEAGLLASAYRESLKLAASNNLSSISFPSISTGAYGYPVDEASRIAVDTIVSFLRQGVTSLREVAMVLFDSRTFMAYASAFREVLNISG